MAGSIQNSQREPHSVEAQRVAGLPRVKSKGLCGCFLCGRFIVLLVFRGGLLGAVQLQDRGDPNFPDALLRVCLLAGVFPAAQFAFHLDMCALGERLGELRELAEDYATVPFGVRDVLVVLLVGGLGCQRECREAAVVGGANFWVAAEKADESYFVLVHESVSVCLNFARCCSGHTGRSLASGPGSQVPKVCFLGGARKKFERRPVPWFSNLFWEEPRPRRGAQCEAEDRVPPGVGKAPKL